MSHEPIADVLTSEISGFANRLSEHPLMEAARQGRVNPSTVASYLAGIKCLMAQTPIQLERAAQALHADLPQLVAHFRQKQREEDGHSDWAQGDLVELERVFGITAAGVPNSMLSIVAFTSEIAENRPCHYLVYMLFAEHITVQLGEAWVNSLANQCGIPLSALSSIARHVELDRYHVAEGKDQINDLLRDVSEPWPFVDTVRHAMSHFEAFCDELALSVEPQLGSTPFSKQPRQQRAPSA
ncbi:MAG TPA: hypothetical protein VFU02_03880 [Polyangiaceae bacterium]|nr:hypothetical protein [Polyangiaceae bacterium]